MLCKQGRRDGEVFCRRRVDVKAFVFVRIGLGDATSSHNKVEKFAQFGPRICRICMICRFFRSGARMRTRVLS